MNSCWDLSSECLDAEAFKLVADKLIAEAGVRPRLHTMVGDNNNITYCHHTTTTTARTNAAHTRMQ